MTHIYTLLKISFLGEGIDTKIPVDPKNFPISENARAFFFVCLFVCLLVFAAPPEPGLPIDATTTADHNS